MGTQGFEKRVADITEAVRNISPNDSTTGICSTGKRDGLDQLVEAIDDLLRKSRESVKSFRNAQDAMLQLQVPGGAKQEEKLVEERNLLMDTLEENVPDMIYFKDTQSRFIHISRAHARMFNLKDATDAIGKTDFDFFGEEHARAAFEDEQEIIRTGEPIVNKEEREVWPDRPDAWVLTTKMPLRDHQGAIVGTFGISRDITERKRAEELSRKSQERYRLLFNSINDAAFVYGLALDGRPGRITEANKIACERLGYTRDEFLQMTPLDLDAPEGAPIALKMMAQLKAETHAVWEGIHLHKTGVRIPVEISNHLFDMAGQPAVLCTVRDITGRKELEENLERERTLLETLIDNLPDYVSVKDTESRVLITNKANARVMGLEKAQEAVGRTDFDFFPPVEAARYFADERAVMQNGTAMINMEEESTDRRGHTRWTLTTKVPLKNAQGKVMGVVCTGRDITERKEADERIQDLARFPDEDPNPVMRVSLDGAIHYGNQASRSFLTTWAGAQSGRIPLAYMPELLKAWATSEKRRIEVREGKNVFELTIAPIPSRGYINLYGRDVTEEKSLSEKFLQAQKMEAIGRLAGGIAHDFNNLLTVIGGYCTLMREELVEASPMRGQVEEIQRASRQAAGLTSQLLAFSRKQVLIPRVINPIALLRAVENILARLVGEDVELRTFLDPEAGNIKADPGQIEQVLMNLVANARDAMPEGGKLTIEISNRTLDNAYALEHPGAKAGEYVRLAVSDTGRGMSQEVLSHVFEPFFTTKERGKGTGLGLSTVYGIVKQSDGYVACYSEPGRGTSFTIYFPRTAESGDRTAAPVSSVATLTGSETILLVEDEEMVRQFTKTLLEKSGYTVIGVPGGREALAVIESHKCGFAMLVTDVVMPQMSGRELARKLMQARPEVKVLFVSGYTGNAIVHRGMLDPGIDFMQKPFESREFLAKVREILDRPSA
jgi:two-component system, cell cycle sensor histidine kinase and response regulator CckA